MEKTAAVSMMCELQPGEEHVWDRVEAYEIPGGVALRAETAVAPGMDPDEAEALGRTKAYLELSSAGWQTLVEMWALRHPEAYQRLGAKVAQLQRSQEVA